MPVHLYVRSCYTLLESSIRIPKLIQRTIECGYTSVALTDHNVMYGIPSFLHECREAGVRPIIGMETDVLYHEETVPFLLLAKDNRGYVQLMEFASQLNHDGQLITLEQLNASAAHCFIIAYGEGGWMDSELIKEDREHIITKLKTMKEEISSFDIALSYQESAMWKKRNAVLKQICSNLGIRTCAMNKIWYLNEEESEICRVLNGIRTGKTLNDASLTLQTGRHYLSMAEMKSLFAVDDLQRTEEIANECKADGILPKAELPKYPVPKEGVSSKDYLTGLCALGLKKRLQGRSNPQYTERLKYELDVITRMHYEDYFLIVFDFIRYAKKNGIYVGPGRGSAVGSWSHTV
jgi:DNA polymerase-3 subunit alpha